MHLNLGLFWKKSVVREVWKTGTGPNQRAYRRLRHCCFSLSKVIWPRVMCGKEHCNDSEYNSIASQWFMVGGGGQRRAVVNTVMIGRITYKARNSLTNRAVIRFSRTVFHCISNNNNNNNRPTFPSNMIILSSLSLMCWLNSKIMTW